MQILAVNTMVLIYYTFIFGNCCKIVSMETETWWKNIELNVAMETKRALVLNMTNEVSLLCLMFIHKTRHTSAACQDMQNISESSFHIFTINVKLCLPPCCANTVHFWKCTVSNHWLGGWMCHCRIFWTWGRIGCWNRLLEQRAFSGTSNPRDVI